MQLTEKSIDTPNILERRYVGIALNAVLFATNFLIFYFICISVFQDIIGIVRLVVCWVGAYSMTWVMAFLAKGLARLVLVLTFLGLLYVVLMYKP